MLVDYIFLFADVVRYSLMTNEDQQEVITKLTQAFERTHPGRDLVNPQSGVFLASGDGFVAAFKDQTVHTQPHIVLALAEELQRAINHLGELRVGIHRGPARSYPDFNSRFLADSGRDNNLAGAAVNLSQRIMSLGDPGDILVSDAYLAHYMSERGRASADATFRRLGTIRIKHGDELDVHQYIAQGKTHVAPRRIATYATAQREIFDSLRNITQKVKWAVYGRPRSTLHVRSSLFLYDPHRRQLYLSGFRDGAGLDRADPIPPKFYGLDEGPGVVFQQALTERKHRSSYHELTAPPSLGGKPDHYVRVASKQLKISPEKVKQFRHAAHCYMYLSVHFGGEGHEPFGVVCVDLMAPIFSRAEIERRVRRDPRLRKKNVDARIEAQVRKRLDKLERRLGPFLEKLGTAYAVISQY